MALAREDKRFIRDLQNDLRKYKTLASVARARKANYNSLYVQIQRLGYKPVSSTRLVPIHALDLDLDEAMS